MIATIIVSIGLCFLTPFSVRKWLVVPGVVVSDRIWPSGFHTGGI